MKYIFLVLIGSLILPQAFSNEPGTVECTYLKRGPRKIGNMTSYSKLLDKVSGLSTEIPYIEDFEKIGYYGSFKFKVDDIQISGEVIEGHIMFYTLSDLATGVYTQSVTSDTFKILTLTQTKLQYQVEGRCRFKK